MGKDRQSERTHRVSSLEAKKTLEEVKEPLLRLLEKKRKKILEKKEKISLELEKAKNWEKDFQEANLLLAHLSFIKKGMKEIELANFWEEGKTQIVALQPALSAKEQIEKRFKQAKKKKKSIPYLEKYLQELKDLLEKKEQEKNDLLKCTSFEDLPKQEKKENPNKKQEITQEKSRCYRLFYSAEGNKILVGKSAKENEILTFQVASGNDYWLHVANEPGSHVVIKIEKGKDLDSETLKDAALLALYYSKAKKRQEAEVHYTQQKYVKKFSGSNLGQVQVAGGKTFFIRWDEERFQEIKKRSGNLNS